MIKMIITIIIIITMKIMIMKKIKLVRKKIIRIIIKKVRTTK